MRVWQNIDNDVVLLLLMIIMILITVAVMFAVIMHSIATIPFNQHLALFSILFFSSGHMFATHSVWRIKSLVYQRCVPPLPSPLWATLLRVMASISHYRVVTAWAWLACLIMSLGVGTLAGMFDDTLGTGICTAHTPGLPTRVLV